MKNGLATRRFQILTSRRMYRPRSTRTGNRWNRLRGTNRRVSVLIEAERQREPVSILPARIATATQTQWIMMSAVSVIELEHGFWRARTPEQSKRRRMYLDEVLATITAQPFTKETHN